MFPKEVREKMQCGTGLGSAANNAVSAPALVSAVVPTHNRSALLQRAIGSICRQTYTNIEIVIVDDASTDDTPIAVRAIKDARIRYLRHDTPRGASAARNTGIRAANGRYIAFLDDDDAWHPAKIARQVAAIGEHDAILCSSDIAVSKRSRSKKTEVSLSDLRYGPFACGGTGVLLARAEVLKAILFDESLPMGQDWDLFIRIARKYRIAYLDMPLLIYNSGDHQRITNSIVSMPVEALERRLAVLHKHREFLGCRWYARHLSAMLLYGLKNRPEKLNHLAYTVRRCGIEATCRALLGRVWAKLGERYRKLSTNYQRASDLSR